MKILLACVALLIVGCDQHNSADATGSRKPAPQAERHAPADGSRRKPSRQEVLSKSNSSVAHLQNLQDIVACMLRHGYLAWADEGGEVGPLTERIAASKMVFGVSHIYPPDRHAYKMEWRLVLLGGEAANDLPASFLKAQCDRPFTHEMAVDVAKEFTRVAEVSVSTAQVTKAMRSAEQKFKRIRQGKPNEFDFWFVSSDLGDADIIRKAGYQYAVRVDIREWPREDYVQEHGACRVTIYFVYLPPDVKIDLSKVTTKRNGDMRAARKRSVHLSQSAETWRSS